MWPAQHDNEMIEHIVALMRSNVHVAIVTAAGYPGQAERFEQRVEGLLAAFRHLRLPAEVTDRFERPLAPRTCTLPCFCSDICWCSAYAGAHLKLLLHHCCCATLHVKRTALRAGLTRHGQVARVAAQA